MNHSVILFLNLGGSEIVLIVLVFLMFFGAKSIPSVARSLGKGIRDFKEAANGIQQEIQNTTAPVREELNKTTSDIRSEVGNVVDVTASVKRETDLSV